jgi:3-oxoadipate enol-lactonase
MFASSAASKPCSEACRPLKSIEPRETVASLAQALLAVRPLVDVLEAPVRVGIFDNKQSEQAPGVSGSFLPEKVLNDVAARVGASRFTFISGAGRHDLTVFEKAVGARLKVCDETGYRAVLAAMPDANQIIDDEIQRSFERKFNRTDVVSFDNTRLNAFSTGRRRGKTVVIVSACGMPAKICERWMSYLEPDHFVITWESRGLFRESDNFDTLAHGVESQVQDLFAVMDHFGVKTAHVMGLCGGAVVAITGAASRPERVSSISIWHGDFEVNGCPKTVHQKNLKALMAMAAEGREEAQLIYANFRHSVRTSARSDLDHLVLYPFATPELLFRYGRLNGSIMNADITPLLPGIAQPSLVITSADDDTAHPEGSRSVAAKLANATLHVTDHGDHLSMFEARPDLTGLASRFIAQEGL